MDEEALFRWRLRQAVLEKYGSLDRFYFETGFSKSHLPQILNGKRSLSLSTMMRLAKALDLKVADLLLPNR